MMIATTRRMWMNRVCSFEHTGERVQNRTDVPPGDGYDVVT
jgi:hypothetical protein